MKQLYVLSGVFGCVALAALNAAETAADPIAARREFRAAIAQAPAQAGDYLTNPDPEIRRYALYCVFKKHQAQAMPQLAAAMKDSDEQVRLTAVSALASLARSHAEAQKMLEHAAANDSSNQVRQIAVKASWPFHRDIKLLRNDPSWDHEIETVKSIPLNELPWKIQSDPQQVGHRKNWFQPGFNTAGWKPVKMGHWETQCLPDYDGIAWYRIEFDMPSKLDSSAVEIAFGAVDESAWVWLNGIYLGGHDIGTEGWDRPFEVDCTKEIKWGAKNVLVVRVLDTGNAGGIWKPIRVDVLK